MAGYGIEEQLPTIAIVAHYDSYGIAPVSILVLSKYGHFGCTCIPYNVNTLNMSGNNQKKGFTQVLEGHERT